MNKIWLVINPDNVPVMAFDSETEAMEYKLSLGMLYTIMEVKHYGSKQTVIGYDY